MKEEYQIEIDLTPYDVDFSDDGRALTIKNCMGSILGELDNSVEKTGNRFSEERASSFYINDNDKAVYLDFDFEDDGMSIYFTPMQTKDEMMDITESWISSKFDAIKSIGYEVLEKENYVCEVVKELGYEGEDAVDNKIVEEALARNAKSRTKNKKKKQQGNENSRAKSPQQ